MADVKYLIRVDDKGTPKVEAFGDEIGGLENKANKSGTSLKGMFGKIALGAVAIGLAVKGMRDLKRFMGSVIDKAIEQERVETALNSVIRATGGAAGLTASEVKGMALALQSVTTFGDEAIISGQNLLLTFKNIGEDVFPDATEIMLDMSEALGQDLKSSAIQLGKALNDPILGVTALQRVGVSFTESQKDMIKKLQESGDLMGAQTVILDELKGEFGGAARAARDTFGGALDALNNIIGDAKEELGGVITENEALRDVIADVTEKIQELIEDGTLAEWAAGTAIVVVKATKAMAQALGGLVLIWKSLPIIVYEAAAGVATAWGGMTAVYLESLKVLSGVIPGLEDDIRAVEMAYAGLEWSAGLFSDEADNQRERVKLLRTEYDDFLAPLDAAIAAFEDYKDKVKDGADATDDLGDAVGDTAGDLGGLGTAAGTAGDEIVNTLVPAMNDLRGMAYNTQVEFKDAYTYGVDYFKTKTKEATVAIASFWGTFTDGLQTKWSTEFAKMIELPSKLRDDLPPIFTAIYDTFADMVGKMASEWLVNFIGKFVTSTEDAVETVVGTVRDVADAAVDLAKGFSPGGMIATAIGTAVGTFLGSLLTKGPSANDTRLIKDNTWNTNQNVINLHDANVARLDELKLAAWDRNQILRDILAATQGGGGLGGGGTVAGGRGSGRGGAPSITVNPNVNVDVASTPVTIEIDGRALAAVLIPHIERGSTRGRVKFNQVSLVRT